ncbi:hypothetical protein Csa_001600, partial [Cucumis sativus]
MNKFNSLIVNLGLVDPPLSNGLYTWSNLRDSPVLSRLDKFLYTPSWKNKFSNHSSKLLTRATSNHFPIMIESYNLIYGPISFRINNCFLDDKELLHKVVYWWTNTFQDGYP